MNFQARLVALAALGMSSSLASANVLMLEFGYGAATTAQAENSPYHTVNPSFTGTKWQNIKASDINSLFYADNTAATGVSLNVGSCVNNTVLLLTEDGSSIINSNSIAGQTNTGVYTSGSPGRDAIWRNLKTDESSSAVGVQITGLAAGTYKIYLTGRNTSAGTSTYPLTYSFYAGAGVSGSNFDFSSYASDSVTFTGAQQATTAWVVNGNTDANYVVLTVTIVEGEALNIAAAGGDDNPRGFLNSIQIVAVPEPMPVGMLGLGSLALLIRKK